MSSLIKKYDVPGPRYTSYPTVPYWDSPLSETQWIEQLRAAILKNEEKGCGIYIHIPFCEKLCSYCGCHKFITKDRSVVDPYVHSLLKEWSLYATMLKDVFPLKVSEIHLGGGTPTFLPPESLRTLMEGLYKNLKLSSQTSISVEIDPRTTSDEHLVVMRSLGVSRLSLGVQDFDHRVQKAVNRIQSFELVAQITEKARKLGFESINFDLIYGLPFQTESSIRETIDKVLSLSPDRIAYYSYAHVPWMKASQRLFKDEDLPSGDGKRRLYEIGALSLKNSGYVEIGMDHFAKPTEELSVALQSGSLHRNFMGYTPHKSIPIFGLGVSAIGDSWTAFWQNSKSLESYNQALSEGRLPHEKSHGLTCDDLLIREHILNIMTKFGTSWKENSCIMDDELMKNLSLFESDGLIKSGDCGFEVTELGRSFVRNIGMAFDVRLKKSKIDRPAFSRTV